MKRKDFLSSSASLFTISLLPAVTEKIINTVDNGKTHLDILPVIPPYLKRGDRIGITSPSGYMTREEVKPAVQLIESWGYTVVIGETIGKRDFTFGGNDDERAADFQKMLDDSQIRAILCARGGYGAVRIIDRLKWDHFKRRPKWIIGFSDATVFHAHLNADLNIASIHSKMCNSFPEDWSKAEPVQVETILSIKKALSGERLNYSLKSNI